MKAFKYIGILFVVALVVGGAWFGWQMKQGAELDKTSREFVENGLPKLVEERWYGPYMRPLAHSRFMEAVSMEDWQRLSELYYSKLGPLKQFGSCDGQAKIMFNNGEKIVTADYACSAEFENESAQIQVTLMPEKNDWKIIKINVLSDAFLQ